MWNDLINPKLHFRTPLKHQSHQSIEMEYCREIGNTC